MNWIVFATAWAAVKPALTKSWEFVVKHWKVLAVLGALVISHTFAVKHGISIGLKEGDDAWTARYNEAVADFNKRMKAVGGQSDDLVKIVDKATEKVEVDLDVIDKSVVEAAKKPEHVAQCAPNGKATLNTQLPPELFKAWADMNEAGAKNNPFAEKIKETK